ncbi:FBD domain [Dillenia turbinata]|uniref:FBD domain n=1 Tax=Dillenia turbinata TaxID=194707 RepID=A0AAN8VHY7_9MAGN
MIETLRKGFELHLQILSVRHGQVCKFNPQDPISALAEALIGEILSRLPTKEAVATSVLSSRWRYHWTWIYNFDFDIGFGYVLKHDREEVKAKAKAFADFVNRVLTLTGTKRSIQKFSLHLYSDQSHDEFCFNKWVTTVIERDVQELELFQHNMSMAIFSFMSLHLLIRQILRYFVSIMLNSKAIQLLQVSSSCHVLEVLYWDYCIPIYKETISLCMPVLKHLEIQCTYSFNSELPQFLFPHLTTFVFKNFYGEKDETDLITFILKNAGVLMEGAIHCRCSYYTENQGNAIREILACPKASSICQLKFFSIEVVGNTVMHLHPEECDIEEYDPKEYDSEEYDTEEH